MNLVLRSEQYNVDNVYFCDMIKNNIIINGNFIRILYSTSKFTMNGIYILLNFENFYIEKYYNKYKYTFDIKVNSELINFVRNVEIDILTKLNICDKCPVYKIYDQLKIGGIKIITDKIEFNENIILKISGIWETDTEYGITYKFINILDMHTENTTSSDDLDLDIIVDVIDI
jgi:hypothetical protein